MACPHGFKLAGFLARNSCPTEAPCQATTVSYKLDSKIE